MFKLHLPGLGPQPSDPLGPELVTLQDTLRASGLEVPSEYEKTSFLAGVAGAFLNTEMPPVERLPGGIRVSTRSEYSDIRTDLKQRAGQKEEAVFAVAHQVGRALGAAVAVGLFQKNPPVAIQNNEIAVDNSVIGYSPETGTIIDYGMGFNGLIGHVDNLKRGAYSVVGMHRSQAETTTLQGIAEYFGVTDGLTLTHKGLAQSAGEYIRAKSPQADIVIASRVHMAGADLKPGIQKATEILHDGGLLVARGPHLYRTNAGIFGYDAVLKQIQANRRLHIVAAEDTTDYSRPTNEKTRFIVAQKQR